MATEQVSCGKGRMGEVSCLKWITEKFEQRDETTRLRDENILIRFKSLEKSIEVAAESLTARLEALNNLREQVNAREIKFMTIDAFTPQHEKLEGEINRLRESVKSLELSKERLAGKASMVSVLVGYAFSVLALIIAAVSLWH